MGATNTLYFCLNSQTRLDSLIDASSNPVNQIKDTLGTLSALNSSGNRQGWNALPINVPGRSRPSSTSNRKVALSGRVRSCPSVQTSAIDYCAGTTAETSDLVDTEVTVDNYRGVTFTVDRDLYRDTCDTADGRAADVIAYKLQEAATEILKKEDNDAVAALQADVTTYFDGTSVEKTIPLYGSTVPRVPQPGNLYIIISEYNRKGYSQGVNPIMVGGTGFGRWMFDSNFYIGNDAGSDISRFPGGLTPFVDYQVDALAADGSSHLLSWVPGHAQMLYWTDYPEGSPLRRSNGEITKTTTVINGEVFDLVVYDANCDDNVDVTLSRYSKPYIIPSAFFSDSCGGEQTVLQWTLDCADTTCDNIFLPDNIIT